MKTYRQAFGRFWRNESGLELVEMVGLVVGAAALLAAVALVFSSRGGEVASSVTTAFQQLIGGATPAQVAPAPVAAPVLAAAPVEPDELTFPVLAAPRLVAQSSMVSLQPAQMQNPVAGWWSGLPDWAKGALLGFAGALAAVAIFVAAVALGVIVVAGGWVVVAAIAVVALVVGAVAGAIYAIYNGVDIIPILLLGFVAGLAAIAAGVLVAVQGFAAVGAALLGVARGIGTRLLAFGRWAGGHLLRWGQAAAGLAARFGRWTAGKVAAAARWTAGQVARFGRWIGGHVANAARWVGSLPGRFVRFLRDTDAIKRLLDRNAVRLALLYTFIEELIKGSTTSAIIIALVAAALGAVLKRNPRLALLLLGLFHVVKGLAGRFKDAIEQAFQSVWQPVKQRVQQWWQDFKQTWQGWKQRWPWLPNLP